MAGKARRQYLTHRCGQNRAAKEVDQRIAVQRKVHRLTCLQVVERRDVGVHRRIPPRGQRVDVDLVLERRAQFAQTVGRRLVKHPVGLAILHGGHLGLVGQTEVILNDIGIAVRLRRFAPHREMRIARHRHAGVGVIGRNRIGSGARNRCRSDIGCRRVERQDRGMRQRQLVQKLGIGPRQIDRHGACRRIRHNAALQRAACRIGQTFVRPDDHRVKPARGRAGHFEDPLERGHHILGAHLCPVGKLDALAQSESIGLAVIADHRHVGRKIRHFGKAFRTGGLLERYQSVIDALINLPVLQGIVDHRVHRPCRRARHKPHRATAMFSLVFGLCHPAAEQSQRRGCKQKLSHSDLPLVIVVRFSRFDLWPNQSCLARNAPTVAMQSAVSSTCGMWLLDSNITHSAPLIRSL